MIHPLNDFAMVKVTSPKKQLIEVKKDTAESGILIELPDEFLYYGMYSFAYEASFMNHDALKKLYDYWSKHIGHRVYWLALSEKGAVIEHEGETYIGMKLTSLMFYDDNPDSEARNIHGDGNAAFKV